jgi:hydrogenase nickel incorporation protein HypA/HybF
MGGVVVHELSLCNAIATTVTEHAAGKQVDVVRLKVGHFRQVVPDTLRFCWANTVLGGPLDGARLDIVAVPAVVVCRDCKGATTLDEPLLRCAGCNSADVDLVSGEEFLIDSIDVTDATASANATTGD